MFLAEKEQNSKKFGTYADALWWGVVRKLLIITHNEIKSVKRSTALRLKVIK